MKFDSIESAINEIQNGQSVIIVDDADRENEGDIVMASELITPDAVNFMAKYARGLICVSLSEEQAEKLSLNLMEKKNTGLHETNFTISVDKKNDTTTGISAFDRSKTIRALVDENSKGEDFARPGHIFPIIGKEGGVLRRAGHTEAGCDLAKLAGLEPSSVIVEILNEDGLRNQKEFVNHKILDCIGDLFLSGYKVVGKIVCSQGGHKLTNDLLRKVYEDKKNFIPKYKKRFNQRSENNLFNRKQHCFYLRL